ncbi:RNA polymerase sigma factor [Paludisphaera mucosa]|uniref:Sigma-70 family RNA polymerase sigma factor n=1 Tax=Paludisphaera mucosa TaxID=3030827 RepID=A0ABT6FK35_9BACT|nr:sigma-70 family RNA polymerase sigma factor [Paludisphaera mucosa]MDG3007907.1 sigma-70 family RNA polymerase sigma factor [Paludisphaera mucosa]
MDAEGPDWGGVLARHDGWLRRVVSARLREPQGVDEVMQEVALAVVAQRAPLLDPARLGGWLYRLAVRQALLHRRKAGRGRALIGRCATARPAAEAAPEPSPLAWLLHDERRDLVRRALDRLPPRDADLLALKHGEGWSARELAERLGVGVPAIEARLSRARKRLRAELQSLTGDFEEHDP